MAWLATPHDLCLRDRYERRDDGSLKKHEEPDDKRGLRPRARVQAGSPADSQRAFPTEMRSPSPEKLLIICRRKTGVSRSCLKDYRRRPVL
jgi:hypothetical protein